MPHRAVTFALVAAIAACGRIGYDTITPVEDAGGNETPSSTGGIGGALDAESGGRGGNGGGAGQTGIDGTPGGAPGSRGVDADPGGAVGSADAAGGMAGLDAGGAGGTDDAAGGAAGSDVGGAGGTATPIDGAAGSDGAVDGTADAADVVTGGDADRDGTPDSGDGAAGSDGGDDGTADVADGAPAGDDGGDGPPNDAGDTAGSAADGEVAGYGDTGGTPDGGACVPAVYGTHTYALCEGPLSWADAQNDCLARGMRLARIDDAEENLWVSANAFANVDPAENHSFVWRWLGGNDLAVHDEWRWSDGTLFWLGGGNGSVQNGLYANWAAGHPGAGGGASDCAVIQHNTKAFWGGWDCATPQPYVCEEY